MMKNLPASLFLLISALRSAIAAPTQQLVVVQSIEFNGQIIDWVLKESQGTIASPPPLPENVDESASDTFKEAVFETLPAGPPGTVPILRSNKVLPPKSFPQSSDQGSAASSALDKRQYSDVHWYAFTSLNVSNIGGAGRINIYNPYVESSSDFSLLQIAVVREGVPNGKGTQTVEAGWQRYEDLVASNAALFTYFTTDGYASSGDNVGGYNTDQKGWVQVSTDIYPGIQFSPTSKINGTQYDFALQYRLYQGNWWLLIKSEYIGYYPTSLFSAGTTQSASLANHSSAIGFYGEVLNSEQALTTTDMGSGDLPSAGIGKAAYMRNLQYTNLKNQSVNYSTTNFLISDPTRYNLSTFFNSGTSLGSYMLVGGPGAGGVVGG